MAARTTLNARNLEALGAPRLAELLLELTAGDAAAKRRLRLALAGAEGPAEVARAVRKRLAEIGRSTAFVDWRRQHALADDLDTQRRAIAEEVARADAPEALDLMWRLLDLADPVLSRCDDSGTVSDVFTEACSNLGEIAGAAGAAPRALADRAFEAACRNDYGQYDELVPCLAPALGREGLEHLRERMIAFSNEPVRQLPDEERRVYAYGLGGPVYADEIAASSRASTVRLALMAIADALGDADAFAAQYDERARKVPRIGAEIAQRLLAAGRAEEAWQALQAAEPRGGLREHEWEVVLRAVPVGSRPARPSEAAPRVRRRRGRGARARPRGAFGGLDAGAVVPRVLARPRPGRRARRRTGGRARRQRVRRPGAGRRSARRPASARRDRGAPCDDRLRAREGAEHSVSPRRPPPAGMRRPRGVRRVRGLPGA
jgi:hypothetical protein